jgi:hypothetical protein
MLAAGGVALASATPPAANPNESDLMDSAIFDELEQTMRSQGAEAALERLCVTLRDRKEYANLFYALLLKKRHALGLPPVQSGAADDLPQDLQGPYEDAIREAGRLVGRLYLQENNIPHAWMFYRMLGEPAPVAEAIEAYRPKEDEDSSQIINIAFHEGVHPRKGFDLLLERNGICSAITTLGGYEFPHGAEAREYCIKRLVRALHRELLERLSAEIARQEGTTPTATSVNELIAGRDWLFQDDFYHVDVSHLGAVVQMSIHLPACEELKLARELCAYGKRLSTRFQYNSDPPFEDQYRDYDVYLAILAGEDVEAGIDHFRAKADNADPETVGTYPAEVLVNLLLRLDRTAEALEVAKRHLALVEDRRLTCPTITELCQRTGDYAALAEVARKQENPVQFVAGLLAAR